MAKSLYISAAESYSGKVIVSLGVMDLLSRTIHRIGFFRPIARPTIPIGSDQPVVDRDVHLIHGAFQLDEPPEAMYGVTAQQAEALLAQGREADLVAQILEAYKALEARVDFVLCEGSDFVSTLSPMEEDFNGSTARNLNAPVVVVVDGSSNDPDVLTTKTRLGLDSFTSKGCEVLAVILNKVDAEREGELRNAVVQRLTPEEQEQLLVASIPFEATLATPRMHEVVACLAPQGGDVLFGERHLNNKVARTVVASGSVETIIPLLDHQVLLISHVDRHDVLLMAMTALTSHRAANIGGVVLTGQKPLAEPVLELLRGVPGPRLPIVMSGQNTHETMLQLNGRLRAALEPTYVREIEVARQLFQSHVDTARLA
ncbi:MAG: AAA family ATPase, partial [Myxococcota bacterium]